MILRFNITDKRIRDVSWLDLEWCGMVVFMGKDGAGEKGMVYGHCEET